MPIKLSFVISSLGAGGAERVISMLASHWAERGWPTTLLTFDDGSTLPFYPLHPAVDHRPMGIAGSSRGPLSALFANLHRIRVLRRALDEAAPDAIVAFIERANLLTLLATLGRQRNVIASERIDPGHYSIGQPWQLLRRWLYPRLACLVVQTAAARDYFPRRVRERTRVIPNPVRIDENGGPPPRAGDGKLLLAMGRLTEQKGFDLLLRAFARVAPAHPEWRLLIHGEGETRDRLQQLALELGVEHRARLGGNTPRPVETMRQADLFVLSSRFEGFPNVLCEAMAVGLPVVSFDCPSGPGEIVRDGVDGLLVPPQDVDALSAALERLMGDADERVRLARRAPEVRERFGMMKVVAQWEAIFRGLQETGRS